MYDVGTRLRQGKLVRTHGIRSISVFPKWWQCVMRAKGGGLLAYGRRMAKTKGKIDTYEKARRRMGNICGYESC